MAQVSDQRAPLVFEEVDVAICVDPMMIERPCFEDHLDGLLELAVVHLTRQMCGAKREFSHSLETDPHGVARGCIPADSAFPPAVNHNGSVQRASRGRGTVFTVPDPGGGTFRKFRRGSRSWILLEILLLLRHNVFASAFVPIWKDSALNMLLSVILLRGESSTEIFSVSPRTSSPRCSIPAINEYLTSPPPLIPREIWQFAANGARTTTLFWRQVGSMGATLSRTSSSQCDQFSAKASSQREPSLSRGHTASNTPIARILLWTRYRLTCRD